MIIYLVLMVVAGLGAAWCAHRGDGWGAIVFLGAYLVALAALAMTGRSA